MRSFLKVGALALLAVLSVTSVNAGDNVETSGRALKISKNIVNSSKAIEQEACKIITVKAGYQATNSICCNGFSGGGSCEVQICLGRRPGKILQHQCEGSVIK